jgi:hypothetical protein
MVGSSITPLSSQPCAARQILLPSTAIPDLGTDTEEFFCSLCFFGICRKESIYCRITFHFNIFGFANLHHSEIRPSRAMLELSNFHPAS